MQTSSRKIRCDPEKIYFLSATYILKKRENPSNLLDSHVLIIRFFVFRNLLDLSAQLRLRKHLELIFSARYLWLVAVQQLY